MFWCFECIKINEIVNKWSGCTQSSLDLLILLGNYSQKNKEKTQKFKETGNTKYIFKNKFDKACFQHGMTHGGFKDLARKIGSDKVLRDKASNFAKNAKHDGYQSGLSSIVYDFFDKKYSGNGVNNEIKQNEQSADY